MLIKIVFYNKTILLANIIKFILRYISKSIVLLYNTSIKRFYNNLERKDFSLIKNRKEKKNEKLFKKDNDIFLSIINASVSPPTGLCRGRRKED